MTIGRPVSSRASTRISSASSPSPWNAYGEVRGLNAPPRSIVTPCGGDGARGLEGLLARLDAARPGDEAEVAVADPAPAGLDHGRIGRELARDELVRLEDRQHLLDAGVALERQRREQLALADGADHGRLAAGSDERAAAGLLEARDDVVHLVGRALAPMTIEKLWCTGHGHRSQLRQDHPILAQRPTSPRVFSGISAHGP